MCTQYQGQGNNSAEASRRRPTRVLGQPVAQPAHLTGGHRTLRGTERPSCEPRCSRHSQQSCPCTHAPKSLSFGLTPPRRGRCALDALLNRDPRASAPRAGACQCCCLLWSAQQWRGALATAPRARRRLRSVATRRRRARISFIYRRTAARIDEGSRLHFEADLASFLRAR